jgi:hypothetical protein
MVIKTPVQSTTQTPGRWPFNLGYYEVEKFLASCTLKIIGPIKSPEHFLMKAPATIQAPGLVSRPKQL